VISQKHNPWSYAPLSSIWNTQSYYNTLECDFPYRTSTTWYPLVAGGTISRNAHSTHISCSTWRDYLWNIWFPCHLCRDQLSCFHDHFLLRWDSHLFDLEIYLHGEHLLLLGEIAVGACQGGSVLKKACAFLL